MNPAVIRLRSALAAYASHPDPRVESANWIALLVASNQPFYPLYLYWLVEADIDPAWFTFLSTPFFLAVPAVARRSTRAGRALLPLAGIANTMLCAKLFGVQSAVEIFYIPCAVLALLLFRPAERSIALPLAGFCLCAYLMMGEYYGAPLTIYSTADYAALARLNIVSAGMLTAVVALFFSNRMADVERSAVAAGGEESR